ncbi:hypothetical protein B0H13DRAFT_1874609 [Mycena leptocephala]|nr:hypothetical protein B0H13DRAFT_1874609 [Mycena leptocephala]
MPSGFILQTPTGKKVREGPSIGKYWPRLVQRRPEIVDTGAEAEFGHENPDVNPQRVPCSALLCPGYMLHKGRKRAYSGCPRAQKPPHGFITNAGDELRVSP